VALALRRALQVAQSLELVAVAELLGNSHHPTTQELKALVALVAEVEELLLTQAQEPQEQSTPDLVAVVLLMLAPEQQVAQA
jgi:hypothetical protein